MIEIEPQVWIRGDGWRWPLMVIGPGIVVVDGYHTAVKPLIEIGLRVARWACAAAADGDRAGVWAVVDGDHTALRAADRDRAAGSAMGMCGGG